MTATIPPSHLDLIAGPVYAVLTTVAADGQPENTVVWCSWDGEHVLVNTVAGRRKDKNARHNPLVAITAIDPANPLRWVDVRGYVEAIVPDEGNANIDAHTRLYTDHDKFFGGYAAIERQATEQRVIMQIRPTRVVAYPHQ
ncbi:putative oxidoreductase [Candidatus Promineifilum breve]|uniref:Oxidoreductase n=1 Tax=Candidatus Promineifilum breve TaxID=1806508 RepID=A0A160T5Z8_9CHLR|nr:PPOX class F420-dependent oxidoreductase [Candidatus Promineifilum breve]CUS04365.2 putative oxidoreductase [Candidatus Promineifilum breve]